MPEPKEDMAAESPTPFFTAGGMISDSMDIETWLQALASSMLLSPEMHKEQLTFASPNTSSYGLGVMNEEYSLATPARSPVTTARHLPRPWEMARRSSS
jgi:hypothetical protein